MRKNVDKLLKKQKRRQALKLVTCQDDSKPWSSEARAKVITILLTSYYIDSTTMHYHPFPVAGW